jgi:hypothetical protein
VLVGHYFIESGREQGFLLPPDVRDWLPFDLLRHPRMVPKTTDGTPLRDSVLWRLAPPPFMNEYRRLGTLMLPLVGGTTRGGGKVRASTCPAVEPLGTFCHRARVALRREEIRKRYGSSRAA